MLLLVLSVWLVNAVNAQQMKWVSKQKLQRKHKTVNAHQAKKPAVQETVNKKQQQQIKLYTMPHPRLQQQCTSSLYGTKDMLKLSFWEFCHSYSSFRFDPANTVFIKFVITPRTVNRQHSHTLFTPLKPVDHRWCIE